MSNKGGFRGLSRVAGLADEGKVHEQVGLQTVRKFDQECDETARTLFAGLKARATGAILAWIEAREREYWRFDRLRDASVEAHTTEGIELFEQIGTVVATMQPGAAPA